MGLKDPDFVYRLYLTVIAIIAAIFMGFSFGRILGDRRKEWEWRAT